MAQTRQQKKPKKKAPPTGISQHARDTVALRQVDNETLKIKIAGSVAIIVALCGLVWVLQPIAAEFAGEETVVNVSVVLSVSITLAGVTGLLALILRNRTKRLKEAEEQRDRNAGINHVLQKRLRDANMDDTVDEAELA